MHKRSYHPFVILGYKTGILPQQLLQALPRSTKHHWQHKDLSASFGHGWYTGNQQQLNALKEIYHSKRLMQLNLALLRLIAVKRFMHRHAAALQQGLHNIPATVYNNIKKSAALLGTANALKLLGMAHGKYLSLQKKAVVCNPRSTCAALNTRYNCCPKRPLPLKPFARMTHINTGPFHRYIMPH